MNGNFNLKYNGATNAQIRTYSATSLTTGLPYRFYLIAENYVGQSAQSPYATLYACIAPSGLSPPV